MRGKRYIYDEEKKEVVYVGECNTSFIGSKVWFPRGGYKYYDKALNKTFYSKQEKHDFMRANNLMQDPNNIDAQRMIKSNCEVINAGRKEQGLKTKTKDELVGDSRE